MASCERIPFDSRDGSKLVGVLTVPHDGAPDPGLPAVLLCQGLSGRKDLVLPFVARKFADIGLASFAFDYRGYGESEGERGWIDPGARVEDALDALECLCRRPEIDATRIAVYGLSLGGPVAICTAARDPRLRAVVAVSPPADGVRLLRALRTPTEWTEFEERLRRDREASGGSTLVDLHEILPFSSRFLAKYSRLVPSGGTSTMAHPGRTEAPPRVFLQSARALLEFRPEAAARRLGYRPLLLIAGEDDDVATPEQVRALFDAASGPRELVLMPHCDHVDLDTGEGLDAQADRARRWLRDRLGARGPSTGFASPTRG